MPRKSLPLTLCTVVTALAVAVTPPTAAALAETAAGPARIQATCVFDKAQCGGTIRVREYRPTNETCPSDETCKDGGSGAFSTLQTCTSNHIDDSAKHLGTQSYVIVDTYPPGVNCSGPFSHAVAIAADDKCHPSSDGRVGYRMRIDDDLTVTWLQFADAKCQTMLDTTIFCTPQVNHTVCVGGTTKVLAVKSSLPPVPSSQVPTPPSAASSGAFDRVSKLMGIALLLTAMIHDHLH